MSAQRPLHLLPASTDLDQEEEIRVLTLRGLSGTLLDVVLSDVDTHLYSSTV